MKLIEAVHLTKYYGKTRGIDDLNLTVREGNFLDLSVPTERGSLPLSALCLD